MASGALSTTLKVPPSLTLLSPSAACRMMKMMTWTRRYTEPPFIEVIENSVSLSTGSTPRPVTVPVFPLVVAGEIAASYPVVEKLDCSLFSHEITFCACF